MNDKQLKQCLIIITIASILAVAVVVIEAILDKT